MSGVVVLGMKNAADMAQQFKALVAVGNKGDGLDKEKQQRKNTAHQDLEDFIASRGKVVLDIYTAYEELRTCS